MRDHRAEYIRRDERARAAGYNSYWDQRQARAAATRTHSRTRTVRLGHWPKPVSSEEDETFAEQALGFGLRACLKPDDYADLFRLASERGITMGTVVDNIVWVFLKLAESGRLRAALT